MGQKIRPDSFRLGITKSWISRWFFKGSYQPFLEADETIRRVIRREVNQSGIAEITIDRTTGGCRVTVRAARPGIIIGRGGEGINRLRQQLNQALSKLKLPPSVSPPLNLDIEELKRNDVSAAHTAQQIAWDLEKRLRFRRVVKKYIDQAMHGRDVRGVKIKVAGRLDGAEIARREWFAKGTIPLQTLRVNIEYGEATAFTTFGTIGIKVWVNKGEVAFLSAAPAPRESKSISERRIS